MYKNTCFKDLKKNTVYFCAGLIGLLALGCAVKVAQAQSLEAVDTEAINSVIQEGLDECFALTDDSCKGAMHTLNNICQVAYFPACFGDKWLPMMDHLEKEYKEHGLDSYVTVNNEHFGNDKQ